MVDYGLSMAILERLKQLRVGRVADDQNRIGAPIGSNGLFVPGDVHIEGEYLHWTLPKVYSRSNWVKPTDRMLTAFVRLASSPDEAIARFAARYGVFGAVELKPDARPQPNECEYADSRWLLSRGKLSPTDPIPEPLGLWRELSATVGAILGIAAELNHVPPRSGSQADWKTLGIDFDPSRDKVEDAQFLLWSVVNDWVEAGQISLRLHTDGWSDRRTRWYAAIHIGGLYNLLGGLSLQLMVAVAGAESLFTCSGCRLPYIRPNRAPQHGQNNYCDYCGPDRAKRDADRRRKDKMIESRQLHAKGLNAAEIAMKVNTAPATVRGWLKGIKQDGKTKTRKR